MYILKTGALRIRTFCLHDTHTKSTTSWIHNVYFCARNVGTTLTTSMGTLDSQHTISCMQYLYQVVGLGTLFLKHIFL